MCETKYTPDKTSAKVKSTYSYNKNSGMPEMPNAEPISAPGAQIRCEYSEEAKRYAVASQDLENNRFYASFIDEDGTVTVKYSFVGTAQFDDIEGTRNIKEKEGARLSAEELEAIHKAAVERISAKLDEIK